MKEWYRKPTSRQSLCMSKTMPYQYEEPLNEEDYDEGLKITFPRSQLHQEGLHRI